MKPENIDGENQSNKGTKNYDNTSQVINMFWR